MVDVAYVVVEHDGGWAYKLGDVFSETFPTHRAASEAADRVAALQRVPGETEAISWEDDRGIWHEELEPGSSRPQAFVSRPSPSRPAAKAAVSPPPAAANRWGREIQDRPLQSLLLAAMAGFVVARLML